MSMGCIVSKKILPTGANWRKHLLVPVGNLLLNKQNE
jgi:hypothetical protein